MEKKFVISEQLAQAIADYLSNQPFKQVAALIVGLQKLQPYVEPEDKASKD